MGSSKNREERDKKKKTKEGKKDKKEKVKEHLKKKERKERKEKKKGKKEKKEKKNKSKDKPEESKSSSSTKTIEVGNLNNDQQAKFLRLMGAGKSKTKISVSNEKKDYAKHADDLENQYKQGINLKSRGGRVGLGSGI